jgi:nicotinamide mononucleotide transporter
MWLLRFAAMPTITERFIAGLVATTPLEAIAAIAGLLSVYFSRKEHILVYPIGLVNTIAYVYLSFKFHLPGEATVNAYYTVMSVYGWYQWSRRNEQQQVVLHITRSNAKQWLQQLVFFAACFIVLFGCISTFKTYFAQGALPLPDAFAAATAFTGMWLMTQKKVESWYWWILTNITSIPLYFTKGLVFTSVQYAILLVMAVMGWYSWYKKSKHA